MKRLLSLFLCLAMISVLWGCGGDIKAVKTRDVESDIYSVEDIEAAIKVIKTEFDRNWDGCKLTEIYYAGDEISLDHQDWADRNNADEVIVLLSSFDVDGSGGDGSLNPNSTYNKWNWICLLYTSTPGSII